MCGIVGYVGTKPASPILQDGLRRLEYRGYDSSGICWVDPRQSHLSVIKKKGKLSALEKVLNGRIIDSTVGLGHTRWATHGEPSDENAHPHLDSSNDFAIVENGIFENYSKIRQDLTKKGVKLRSQTDAELAAHLIARAYKGNFQMAFCKAIKQLKGYFAVVAISAKQPNQIIAFKRSNPLVIGVSDHGNFVASDVSALLPYTNKVIYLEDEEYAVITPQKVVVYGLRNNKVIRKKISEVKWNVEQAQKKGYRHFMLKEIYEQPDVSENILQKRIPSDRQGIVFSELTEKMIKQLKTARRLIFVSCGTAYHASIVARYLFEEIAHVACEENVSSEFRYYKDPQLNKEDIVVLISQSGETADTLAALKEAKLRGAKTLAICNVVGSTIAREADAVIYTHAGPEIGVASTKAYVAQLLTLSLLSIYVAQIRRQIDTKAFKTYLKELKLIPKKIQSILDNAKNIEQAAKKLYGLTNFLYLARGFNFANALEGALKLKEISYFHAHGYAAGEMKHGPIALVDNQLPIVCITPKSSTYEKMISNIEELKARDGIIVSIATRNDKCVRKLSGYTFEIPEIAECFSPILTVVPLQLFAYRIAVLNGCDVDQPKNLAKSVTVE